VIRWQTPKRKIQGERQGRRHRGVRKEKSERGRDVGLGPKGSAGLSRGARGIKRTFDKWEERGGARRGKDRRYTGETLQGNVTNGIAINAIRVAGGRGGKPDGKKAQKKKRADKNSVSREVDQARGSNACGGGKGYVNPDSKSVLEDGGLGEPPREWSKRSYRVATKSQRCYEQLSRSARKAALGRKKKPGEADLLSSATQWGGKTHEQPQRVLKREKKKRRMNKFHWESVLGDNQGGGLREGA